MSKPREPNNRHVLNLLRGCIGDCGGIIEGFKPGKGSHWQVLWRTAGGAKKVYCFSAGNRAMGDPRAVKNLRAEIRRASK